MGGSYLLQLRNDGTIHTDPRINYHNLFVGGLIAYKDSNSSSLLYQKGHLNMNKMKKTVKDGYDQGNYVVTFDRNRELNALEIEMFDSLVACLGRGAKILDLGCGIGVPFDKYLAEKGYDVTGVDFSEKHLNTARTLVKGVRFLKGDFTEITFARASYDAVISLYAIFHVPREQQLQLFRRIHNTLKQSGVALFTLGTSSYEYSLEKDWAGAQEMAWSSWSVAEYKKILDDAGFETVKTKYEGRPGDQEYHFWVLCKKNQKGS